MCVWPTTHQVAQEQEEEVPSDPLGRVAQWILTDGASYHEKSAGRLFCQGCVQHVNCAENQSIVLRWPDGPPITAVCLFASFIFSQMGRLVPQCCADGTCNMFCGHSKWYTLTNAYMLN
jgi:hypothetical protein